jgi:hypothetical protein
MAKYRCNFKNSEGIILAYEELPVQTTDEALTMGRKMFAQRPHYPIFELCLGARVIHFESRPARPAYANTP